MKCQSLNFLKLSDSAKLYHLRLLKTSRTFVMLFGNIINLLIRKNLYRVHYVIEIKGENEEDKIYNGSNNEL
ncbi:hypothetical protein V1477_007814 [Vespula maculifrons]|uniref:Uncharacterized protein n=1 Tax=Vespula maculifrons TaxID=7453 RepID=A0ABD2CFU0_VESMC